MDNFSAQPPDEERFWGLGDLGALASILALGAVLAVAPASRILIAGIIVALTLIVVLQRRRLYSRIRTLTASVRAGNTRIEELEALLQDTPSYKYVLSESWFTIEPDVSTYQIEQRKLLQNVGTSTMEFLLAHFTCNRHPEDAEVSRQYYVNHPILWSDLGVYARDTEGDLLVELRSDYNNRKDFVIRLESNFVPRPVAPGKQLDIKYGYKVPFSAWGTYFDKPIDRPTELLRVHIVAPDTLRGFRVGVSKLYPSSHREPLSLEPETSSQGGHTTKSFSIEHPEVGTAYQFTWDYEGLDHTKVTFTPPAEATIAAQQ